jgi:phosphodiesterase/alkaline phosphatase D-like protein
MTFLETTNPTDVDLAAAPTAAFPDGVSSGDVTQASAVVWTRAVETGLVVFQIATDASFAHVFDSRLALASDPLVPVKVEFDHLNPGQHYFYRAIDASGDTIEGSFTTALKIGTHHGFHFAIVADEHGELAPFPAIKNAVTADLDLVVKLGDTIYADIPPPAATTLDEFRLKYDEVYSSHHGFDFLAELQARTPILSVIDDHEVVNDFAGGAPPGSDPRFAGQPADFINETPLYQNGLQAFKEYNAIEDRTYSGTGEDRFDGAPDLYRYNTYGSDAAIIITDARSFRDAELPGPANPFSPADVGKFLSASFDASRTMLGDVQLARLEQDLLDARNSGITWKFVMLGEPIQNFGPIANAGDRYEGYAAERDALLKFIDDNHIENVVFVSSDSHWTSVNNLTYQTAPGGPQIASSAFEVNTLAVASTPPATLLPAAAFQAGLISAEQLALYNSLPNAPDSDSIPNDKDDFVKQILDNYMTKLGYDPIGLESNSKIDAKLLSGDYFVGHDFGWTDFNIDPVSGNLLVTTWGISAYTATDLALDPTGIIGRNPVIVSQFEVTPQSDTFSAAIAGTTVYTKEYGVAPDAAELNLLIEFTTPQYAYGKQIGVMDPAVYAYEALGVALAGSAAHFQNAWGPSNPTYPNSAAGDAQFATDAYNSVFGHSANSALVQFFTDQLNSFKGLYAAAGVFGSPANIDLLARGAIYGQMLGIEAELNPSGGFGVAGTADVSIVGVTNTSDHGALLI